MKTPTAPFAPLTPELIRLLSEIVGPDRCHTDDEHRHDYSHDWTEDFSCPPEAVVFPGSAQEVAQIMRLCSSAGVPVTPVGGRTGLSGGMLPVYGGVALSLERLNRIIEIDTRNLQATVEPGVITQTLQEAALEHGLMYPPDPSSRGSCTLGGNLAENAGGAHAVKYGITSQYVLALEAVLPNGEIIQTGARVLKNSTGYNLTQLLIGSEGTLGIITKMTLKLVPAPRADQTMLIPFEDAGEACQAVSEIFQAGIVPSALEFIEKDAIDFGQQYLGISTYDTEGIEAHLLVEVDGNDESQLFEESQRIAEVIERYRIRDIYFADDAEKKAELWRLRRCLGEAVKGTTIYKEVDTVVPRAELARLLRRVKEVCGRAGIPSVCYGHAGDGNLHVNVIKRDLTEEAWQTTVPQAIREIFEYVHELGGTLSGEHGVGCVLPPYLDIVFSETELALMRGIKQVFDPQGILNPGKIFGD